MLDNVLYLANVTDATSRPAESAAHTNLRRQPHQNVYKKRNAKQDTSGKDVFEQKLRRAISIDALLTFLHDVLKMRQHFTDTPVNQYNPGQNTPSLFDKPMARSVNPAVTNDNVNVHRSRRTNEVAAKAYQRAATSSEDKASVPHENTINSANTKLLGVMDHDAKEIYGVIRDLQVLRRRGVAHIVVSRGDDFIQSVQDAIFALKNA